MSIGMTPFQREEYGNLSRHDLRRLITVLKDEESRLKKAADAAQTRRKESYERGSVSVVLMLDKEVEAIQEKLKELPLKLEMAENRLSFFEQNEAKAVKVRERISEAWDEVIALNEKIVDAWGEIEGSGGRAEKLRHMLSSLQSEHIQLVGEDPQPPTVPRYDFFVPQTDGIQSWGNPVVYGLRRQLSKWVYRPEEERRRPLQSTEKDAGPKPGSQSNIREVKQDGTEKS